MLYLLLEYLKNNYPIYFTDIFQLIEYPSVRAAGVVITSLFFCFLLGPKIIRTLIIHQFGETIRKNGPESHLEKQGTPTMGGIIIIMAIILPTILWAKLDNIFIQICLVSVFWMGIIGFIDDYLKIKKGYPKGLIARYKIIGQLLLGLFIVIMLFNSPSINYEIITSELGAPIEKESLAINSISIPFLKNYTIYIFDNLSFSGIVTYSILVILVIMGTSNAVNLTDGLDGLATGLIIISVLVFSLICWVSDSEFFSNYLNIIYIQDSRELFIFCLAIVGAGIGFLWFNANPAKIFMGDTGSLALGAALGCLAILLKREILLILIGGVFVLESLSVIFQVLYFKYTKKVSGEGKRLLKMAPLHHHFELSGWHENHVVVRLWIIGIILALISLATFKVQ